MSEFRERFYNSRDGLRLYYRDYGGGTAAPVLCIPGLTRNARDFEFIACHIAKTRRVLAADLRGRGKSAPDPEWRHYTVANEAADMMRLLEDAGAARAVILGTSRGGIVAMAMAAAHPEAVAGVVLNDIGGEIEAEGLDRILAFLGRESALAGWGDAVDALKWRHAAAFPGVADGQWMSFARAIYREQDGQIVPDYDPRLGDAMRVGDSRRPPGRNAELWKLFAALKTVPALLMRGEYSDVLSRKTAARMAREKPDLKAVMVRDRGHTPFLDEAEAVTAINRFLAGIG